MACPVKTTITLTITVDDIATALLSYDQIQVWRSTAGALDTYLEVSDAYSRPDLEAGVSDYEAHDEDATTLYWYKWRLYHSATEAAGAFSDPFHGTQHPALDIVNVTELKTNYLFGLDLTKDDGEPYPASLYEHYIKSAVSKLEHKLDVPIAKAALVELHDFYREDYIKYISIELDAFPVISIDEVKLTLPGETIGVTYDPSWVRIDKTSGQLHIVPGGAGAQTLLLGASGAWSRLFYGSARFIPQVFQVTYTAGFAAGKVPPIFKDVVGKLASFGPLNIAGDLLGGAGIASQSVSIDGLSQNFNTTSSSTSAGYGARLIQYSKELKEDYKLLRDFYKGIGLRVA